MDENNLMERTDALVKEYGNQWKVIAEMLHSEGFTRPDGTPLTVDTLRKRHKKWIGRKEAPRNLGRGQGQEKANPNKATEPEETSAHEKSRGKTRGRVEAMIPASALLDLFKGTIERRDAMLAEKLKTDAEKPFAQDRTIEARIEERLLKRLKEELVELVQDLVDRELKIMLTAGGSFERDLTLLVGRIIDEKASGQLISLVEGIDLGHDHKGGPGRGHKGEKMSRFSATMDGETYARMKGLKGTFSSHLASACKLYLRALESKR